MAALMAMLLLATLGAALLLTTSSETIIAGNFRTSGEGLYAADAALERVVDDLLIVTDWNSLLSGASRSGFVDGAPSGPRTLSDGSTIDLTEALNLANCRQTTACSVADMELVTDERPWGLNNPRWQLYGYGRLNDLTSAAPASSPFYVIVMVGDDPSELDRDPANDGVISCGNAVPIKGPGDPPAWSCNPGSGVIAVRAESFGPRGAHKVIEMTVARTDTTGLERGYTGQRGQDEQSRGARNGAVETPGDALTMQTMTLAGGGIK